MTTFEKIADLTQRIHADLIDTDQALEEALELSLSNQYAVQVMVAVAFVKTEFNAKMLTELINKLNEAGK